MSLYAVIDLGSNSIRLVVYRVPDDQKTAFAKKDFSSLINDKVMAGLSAFVDADGTFSEAGVSKAARTLKGHLERASYFGCKRIDIFATAVLRNARNSAEAVSAIEERIGRPLVVLSGRDESHLGFVGVACEQPIEEGTLVDIGGGSTELTCVRAGADERGVSIPAGSLSSFAAHVSGVLPTAPELAAIAKSFTTKLAAAGGAEAYRSAVLYGVGGSVRTAAKMQARLADEAARPKVLVAADVVDVVRRCAADVDSFAHTALTVAPERIHTLVPGCVILGEVMAATGAARVEVCKCGVREGYLIERMLGARAASPAIR